MTPDIIRVVLADDHAVVRAGLRAVLGAARDIQVVGEAADGLTATRALVAKGLRARVLVLTMHPEDEFLVPLLEAGAAGYLVKNAADRDLVDAVRAVAHGDTYVQASGARAMARGLQRQGAAAGDRVRFEKLTERERDVLTLVAGGYSAPEIGEKLSISPKTVDTYKQRIGEKLGLGHRADYVRFALKLGLLTP